MCTSNIELRCYREIFEGVEQQAQGHLGFIKEGLGLGDVTQRAAKNSGKTKKKKAIQQVEIIQMSGSYLHFKILALKFSLKCIEHFLLRIT